MPLLMSKPSENERDAESHIFAINLLETRVCYFNHYFKLTYPESMLAMQKCTVATAVIEFSAIM